MANAIAHIFPDAQRRLEYQASQVNGADLDNVGPYRIQCKRNQNYAPIGKIKEVQAEKGIIPILVTKGNKMAAVVVMYFTDWIKSLEILHGRDHAEKLVDLSGENDIVVESKGLNSLNLPLIDHAQKILGISDDETIEVESPYKEYPMADIIEDGGELFEAEDGEPKTANDIFNPAKGINDFM